MLRSGLFAHSTSHVDDTIATTNDPKGLVSQSIAVVKTVLDSSGLLKTIEAGVNAFVDDIPWLMKGLDEVAKIHPVVTGELTAASSFLHSTLTLVSSGCARVQSCVHYGNDETRE